MREKFIEEAICQKQGTLLASGALAVQTGRLTGRAPGSRFIVQDGNTQNSIDWGDVNKPFEQGHAQKVFREIQKRLAQQRVFEVRGFIGPFPIEVLSTSAWHAAFAENMFREKSIEALASEHLANQGSEPDSGFGTIRIWHDPFTRASQYGVEAQDDALILLDPTTFSVAIIGTAYAGEIKKSAFSLANYLLPLSKILPMHASANCREDGSNASVIFGLSGTGKTTLSAQPGRALIGDDEIAWSHQGLSNLEGGCYAKLIALSAQGEPDIYRAVNKFGSILENVLIDNERRIPNFDDISRTENTRGSYKLTALERVFDQTRQADQPRTVVFLTADAFGALPALARLDEWQAQYHFLSGFTAKVAGTEIGLKEPKATFSACFGAPFMPRTPQVYARLLAEKIRQTGASVWLLNTGWWGGFEKGKRFPLALTRHLLGLIQEGRLDDVQMKRHPIFGFETPVKAPDVPAEYLQTPEGPQVAELAQKFLANQKKFSHGEGGEICERGGPRLSETPSHNVSHHRNHSNGGDHLSP